MDKRKLLLTFLLAVGIVSITLGVSIAFFNYTRTGNINTVATGKIYFNTTQDGNISLTNIFPVDSEDIDNVLEPGNNVTINIEGDTTYEYGVEYLVTAEDVNIEVNNKKIPINLYVTSTSNLGDNDPDYFENRGGNTSLYKVLSGGVVHEGQYLLVGYIAKGQEGIEGSLNIKAYIDKDKIAISDTYDGTESDNMGTTNNWVNGRTVFTTSEWNSLSTSGSSLSFKIRVEANEGVWVDPYTTPNLMNTINFNRNAVNVKEIRFIEETPLRMQRRYDASPGSESNGTKGDYTYQDTGKVLAWIEPISVSPTGTNNELLNVKPKFLFNEEQEENNIEQIDNETSYILYIASSGKTKWVYTGTSSIFSGFSNVEKIYFENFDTSNVPVMNDMFKDLSKLTSVNINALDTSGVYQMTGMFSGCTSLTSIDLSGLGSNNLVGISNMFYNCNALTEIIMKNFNFGHVNFNQSYNNYSNYYYAFANLPNVETIDLTNANTSGVTNMYDLFYGCTKLENIIGINTLDTSNVTDMGYMFGNCSSLTSIDLSGLGGDDLSSIASIFSGCTSLKNINMKNFNFGVSYLNNTSTSIFAQLANVLEIVDLSDANYSGSNVTSSNLSYLFYCCNKLQSVNFTNANTSKVTSMDNMFEGCTSLVSVIGFNTLDTSKVTGMGRMFNRCSSLVSINMDNMGGNSLSDVHYMFTGCTSLKNISMRNFNFGTSSIAGNDSPFNQVSSVEKIDISNSIISNINNNDLEYLFESCTNLKEVSLVNVDTSNVTNMYYMFYNCTSLTTIYVSNTWNTTNVTNSVNMFGDCTSLVGGNGTVFDSTKIDKTMAVIDTPSTPGYLTYKA